MLWLWFCSKVLRRCFTISSFCFVLHFLWLWDMLGQPWAGMGAHRAEGRP